MAQERSSPPRSRQTTVEHTTPLWRVLAVALAAGSIAALGFYLERVGHADDFATVVVITAAFSVSFWARKRPDRLQVRFGPFGRIADAIRESGDDVREYVYRRPLRVGVMIAMCYGVAVVAAKAVVVTALGALYSWELAVAAGAAVGAVAAAPHLFSAVARRLYGEPEESGNSRSERYPSDRGSEDE